MYYVQNTVVRMKTSFFLKFEDILKGLFALKLNGD